MRILGYILLIGGVACFGYGLLKYFTSMSDVKWLESQLPAAKSARNEAKGTIKEDAATKDLNDLHGKLLEERPEAAKARAHSMWWLGGGGICGFFGLIFVLFFKPRRRRTRGRNERFWA